VATKTKSEPETHAGLNKDLCSIALQFFNNEPGANKKPTASVKPLSSTATPPPAAAQPPAATQPPAAVRPPAVTRPPQQPGLPERASFEPFDEKLQPEEDEEDDLVPI
jgi:hypothetical protein